MKIDYSSLEKAINQMEKSIEFLNSEMAEENHELKDQFRSAVIQAFEYTYELAYRMIRRQLGQIVSNPAELKEMSFMELVRLGRESGLVNDVPKYREYREMRNITSHTYDLDKAEEIIAIIDPFRKEMNFLLGQLKKRNSGYDETN